MKKPTKIINRRKTKEKLLEILQILQETLTNVLLKHS